MTRQSHFLHQSGREALLMQVFPDDLIDGWQEDYQQWYDGVFGIDWLPRQIQQLAAREERGALGDDRDAELAA